MDYKDDAAPTTRRYPWYDDRVEVLQEEEGTGLDWPYNTLPPRDAYDTPKKIYGYLDGHVWKQDAAKKAASIIAYNCFERAVKSNALFVGPSGCGKTHIWRCLKGIFPDRIEIVDGSNLTLDGWKGEKKWGSLLPSPIFRSDRHAILVIDEADKLVSKYTQKKMEILRAIFDQSDVGLVIAGEPKLEAQIKTYLARMANRVDFYASLRGLAPSEVEGYLEDFNITPDALLELKERACNMRTGCFRLLDRTLSNVGRILAERGEDTVTVKIIEQASSMMML